MMTRKISVVGAFGSFVVLGAFWLYVGGVSDAAAPNAADVKPIAPRKVVTVKDSAQLRAALGAVEPGTHILLAPGEYQGGIHVQNVKGTKENPIVIGGADPQNLPHIKGGGVGMQLAEASYVEVRDLRIFGATGNGLSIDDGGTFDTPAHHIVMRNLQISDIGPTGNRDAIKLSGVDDFRVENCRLERWGTGSGSGIDMVGCHRGLIINNTFIHEKEADKTGGNAVQAKGGCRDIAVRRNRFEHAGQRAVNLGGSTGFAFFRPPLDKWPAGEDKYEAKNIRVEGNTFIGSMAPVAFVGVDGAVVRYNTIYQPGRWALRILQETTTEGFAPSRSGVFSDNLVVFLANQWAEGGVNIGAKTQPASFSFARNWWFNEDSPQRSRPTLPTPETAGVYGQDPLFEDAPNGKLRLKADSPALKVGADAWPAVEREMAADCNECGLTNF